jgi:hypothetical protein
MGHAEGGVTGLVARRQATDLARDRVGRMLMQGVQKVDEAALAQRRQQKFRR